MRTQANAAKLLGRGFAHAYYLEGGIEAWKQANLPVHTNRKAPLEIMRQVQITAGLLILTGAVLVGLFIRPFTRSLRLSARALLSRALPAGAGWRCS